MTMGTMLDQNEFQELAAVRHSGCLSLYLPTHRRGPEVRQDPIRLGNLLREAEARAAAADLDTKAVDRASAPLRELLDDTLFWQHQDEGLALFAHEDRLWRHRLPYPVAEHVVAGDRFCLRPLLPAVDPGQRFFVLALSQNRVRLLQCTRQRARELDLHDIPQSLADALGYDWEQKSLQFRSGGRRPGGRDDAMFHGHGRGSDEGKDELRRFLQAVDAGICRLPGVREAPLVVAAVGYVASIYQQVSDHPRLLPTVLEGNPDGADAEQLQQRALPLVDPQLSRETERQLARLAEVKHTPQATTELQRVLAAARNAQVEVLLVATDRTVWGTCDPERDQVTVHRQRQDGDEDLLDLALARSLATGAQVFGVGAADLAEDAMVAAILRFST